MHYRHILFATDGSEEGMAAGEHAAGLAGAFDARLSLLRVLEHLPFDQPVDDVPPEDVDQVTWYRERAQEALNGFAARLGIAGNDAHVVLSMDAPEAEIIRFAEEHGVDLVIVGARERHGVSLFRGATTDTVVHNAPCDVLVVHV